MGDMGAEAGNYKGVMLCNRPTDGASQPGGPGPQHLTPAIDAPSFRPVGLPAEPLGLNPAKENLVSNVLASYREQAGAAGPASQLLASLGVDGVGFGNLHSDDDEEGAEEEGAEQTRC